MEQLIGHTPMIKLNYCYLGVEKYMYVKLEQYHVTGSIKDRVALYILKEAKRKNILKEGMPIVEATSGNTGISFAAIGSYYHHPVIIYMPDWVSKERVLLMKSYGAIVHLVSKEQGGFLSCITLADECARRNNGFRPNQFINEDNVKVHLEQTGGEILCQLPEKIGGFVSGIGTGGTLMGVGQCLKKEYSDSKIIALEPKSSPLLTEGVIGEHKIEGIGDDFIPSLVDQSFIDDVVVIDDRDAIAMAQKLAHTLGLGVGISSGANALATILIQEKYSDAAPFVTVFVDDNKKYLSTPLNTLEKSLLCDKIELLSFEVCKER